VCTRVGTSSKFLHADRDYFPVFFNASQLLYLRVCDLLFNDALSL